MLSRRVWLAFSVVCALLAYALLWVAAPRIALIQARAAPPQFVQQFELQLRDSVPPMPARVQDSPPDLTARPGSVRDLLKNEAAELNDTLEDSGPAPIPDLGERLASDPAMREHDLAPDPLAMKQADARILEITQAAARDEINVARRVVRPSPDRLLDDSELPTLRAPGPPDPLMQRFEPPGSQLLLDPSTPPAEEADTPPYEPPTPAPPTPERIAPLDPIALAPERAVIQTPLKRMQEAVRQESAYTFIDDLVDISLRAYAPPGEPGYFELTIAPKPDVETAVLPKDVTFVIDASSSISQHKLTETARGVRDSLDALRPEDYFNVVLFRDSPRLFRSERVPATPEAIAAAREFLSDLESRGETDVYTALTEVIKQPPAQGRSEHRAACQRRTPDHGHARRADNHQRANRRQ